MAYTAWQGNVSTNRSIQLISAASGETYHILARKSCEVQTGTAIARAVLWRVTGSLTTSGKQAQMNTRSRAQAATTGIAGSITTQGNPLVIVSNGSFGGNNGMWRPPRPWAAPHAINGETIHFQYPTGAPAPIGYLEHVWEEAPPTFRKDIAGRRPRRGWLWAHRQNEQRPGLSVGSGFIRQWENVWCGNVKPQPSSYVHTVTLLLPPGITPSDTGLSISDSIQMAVARPQPTDTGLSITDAAGLVNAVVLSDTGVSVSDALAKVARKLLIDTGLTVTDSLASLRLRPVTDTGLTITDSLHVGGSASWTITDTGLTLSDSLGRSSLRPLSDTGLTTSDTLAPLIGRFIEDDGLDLSDSTGDIQITDDAFDGIDWSSDDFIDVTLLIDAADTGLTISDSISASPTRSLILVDFGLVFSDAIQKNIAKVIADTGLTVTDSIGRPRTGTLTDTGLTVTDSILKKTKKLVSDQGLTITSALVAVKNGSGGSVNFADKGITLSDSISVFSTQPGLVDTGLNVMDGIVITATTTTVTGTIVGGSVVFTITVKVSTPIHTRPVASFTFAVSGLSVVFNDTSTPGSSGPITAWAWNFGDSNTSTSENPTHTYLSPGTYTVSLTVTGTSPDGSNSTSLPVTVFVPSAMGVHIDAVIV